jgi:uncharacterized membrane protein YobD (UPF0266 family)
MGVQCKKWILIGLLVALLIMWFVIWSIDTKSTANAILFLTMLVWMLLYAAWYRCPNCKRHLGRFRFGDAYCPYCGEDLED